MTVPHISAPAWTTRRTRVFAPATGSRTAPVPREHVAPRSAPQHLALWIDMSLQIVIGGAIIAFVWAVVAQGVFTRTVDGFTDWYIGSVAPAFGIGTQPIWADAEYREGFFVDRPEAPASLTYHGPRDLAD